MKCAVCGVLAEAFADSGSFYAHVSWHLKEVHRERVAAITPVRQTAKTSAALALWQRMKQRERDRLRRERDPEGVRARDNEWHRIWRAANPDAARALVRRSWWKHREEYALIHAIWYQDHREEISARRRQYRQEHRDEIAAYRKQYRQDHREEINAKQRQHWQEHLEQRHAYQTRYRQKHHEERAAANKAWRDAHPGYGNTDHHRALERRASAARRRAKGVPAMEDIVRAALMFEDMVTQLRSEGWTRKDMAELTGKTEVIIKNTLKRRVHKAHPGVCSCEQQRENGEAS